MRKLDYGQEKVHDLLEILDALGFHYEKLKDSLEITISAPTQRKMLAHELSKSNDGMKTPPLSYSFDAESSVISVFDSRM